MTPDEILYWQIEDYIQGRLKGEDLYDFKKKLEQDENLREQVSKQKLTRELIIRQRLLQASSASSQTRAKLEHTFLRKLGLWSGILMVTGLSLYFFINNKERPNVMHSSSIPSDSVNNPSSFTESYQQPVRTNKPLTPGSKLSNTVKTPVKEQEKAKGDTVLTETFAKTESREAEQESVPNESVVQKKEEVHVMKDPCDHTSITAHVNTEPACKEQHNGRIHISGFTGGRKPYHTTVVSSVNEEYFSALSLPAGIYHVLITDADKCTAKLERVMIKEVTCGEEKSFNPFLGEVLELEEYQYPGKLIITSKSGRMVYSGNVYPGEPTRWNGISLEGQMATGYYSYELKYEDGTSKTGNVTVTR